MPDVAELHPGALIALARTRLNETQVAKAIAAGELASPQQFANSWYFAIRISGTGGAYRIGLKEFVWRDPRIYLRPEFLERCYGLPVIVEHPKKEMLDSVEYMTRNIGSIVVPFVRGEEVWGVARILDQAAAAYMRDHDISTSPGVVFGAPEATNEMIQAADGRHLLIEGDPSLLDHVAICDEGVWDKGGPPTGVDNTAAKESEMAEEVKTEEGAAQDRARDDAHRDDAHRADRMRDDAARRDEKLDKLLTGIKVLNDRMDSIEKAGRADEEPPGTEARQAKELAELAAEEAESAASEAEEEVSAAEDSARRADTYRDDAARRDVRSDARRRLDAARKRFDAVCGKMRDDKRMDALRKRMDAAAEMLGEDDRGRDDRRDRRDAKRDDEEEEGKMPWKEADRKDGEDDEEYSQRVDALAAKHDASFRKRDDESIAAHCDRAMRGSRRDRARRDSRAKLDSIDRIAGAMDSLMQRVDRLSQLATDRSADEENAFADAQARADAVFQAHGEHAPRPLAGQNLMGYRIMVARRLQKFSQLWRETDLAALARADATAFANVEGQVYADAQKSALLPSEDAPTGRLREIKRTLPGGHRTSEFQGHPLSWMATFMSPGRTTTRLRPKD